MVQPVFDKPMLIKKPITNNEGELIIYTDIAKNNKSLLAVMDSSIYRYIDNIYPGVSYNEVSYWLTQYSNTDYRFYAKVICNFQIYSVYLWQYKSLPEWAR